MKPIIITFLLLLVPVTSFSSEQQPPPPNRKPDDRQAAMLKNMGYTWNGKAWVRGDAKAYQQQRAAARSSNRFIRFVNGQNQPASSQAAVAAAKRLEEVLSRARQDAMPRTQEAVARDRDYKNFCQQRQAPFLWVGAEVLALIALCQVRVPLANGAIVSAEWSREWQHLIENPVSVVAIGVIAGVLLSQCRATSRSLQPGVEEPDGKLTRVLGDTIAERSIALPAPNQIRYSNPNWRLVAFIGETIAAINVSVLMNGILQPVLIRTGSDAFVWRTVGSADSTMTNALIVAGAVGAALLTAMPAGFRAAKSSGEPWDGIRAECEAVVRSKQTVGAYFNMNQRIAGDPLQATEAFQRLADGWLEKFQSVSQEAEWKQPLLAFTGSLACAMAFQLSGGSLAAPFLARVVAAGDTYLVRDEQELCRKSVLLDLKEKEEEKEPVDQSS
jgi:hypothetical protein